MKTCMGDHCNGDVESGQEIRNKNKTTHSRIKTFVCSVDAPHIRCKKNIIFTKISTKGCKPLMFCTEIVSYCFFAPPRNSDWKSVSVAWLTMKTEYAITTPPNLTVCVWLFPYRCLHVNPQWQLPSILYQKQTCLPHSLHGLTTRVLCVSYQNTLLHRELWSVKTNLKME